MNKDFNYKVVYNLKIQDKKAEKKRVITKILKIDENNQYGNGMAKLLPTGCTKDNSDISWETFNFLLEKVDFEDTISHLYIVDIEFDSNNNNNNKKKKMPQKRNQPIIKFTHQLLKNKKLLILVKDRYFNY